MTQELIKKLKDAGFSLMIEGEWESFKEKLIKDHSNFHEESFIKIEGDAYVVPNLSELIKACGDRFRWLGQRRTDAKKKGSERQYKILWEAQARGSKTKTEKGWISTKDIKINNQTSPEEAVAELWLKLNVK